VGNSIGVQQPREFQAKLRQIGEFRGFSLAPNRVATKLQRSFNAFAVTALCAAAVGCRTKSEQAAPPGVHVYGLAAHEAVAPECKAYAQQLLKCVANDHFPADAKDAEKSALAQMMDGMKLDDVAPAARAQALSDAAGRCQDALDTLRESSKTSCPGVL
jgi:hypothetical protein